MKHSTRRTQRVCSAGKKRRHYQVTMRNTKAGDTVQFDTASAAIARLRRRVFAWADTLAPLLLALGWRFRLVMVTLTYREGEMWQPNQIREYLQLLRYSLGCNLRAYAWVAELQRNGRPHYHVLLVVRKGTDVPMPDKSGQWPYGLSRIETARTVYYIARYVGKEYQKSGEFPRGMRKFAVWIAKSAIAEVERWYFKLSALPGWLVERLEKIAFECGICISVRRRRGGGWYSPQTGELFDSPWVLTELTRI